MKPRGRGGTGADERRAPSETTDVVVAIAKHRVRPGRRHLTEGKVRELGAAPLTPGWGGDARVAVSAKAGNIQAGRAPDDHDAEQRSPRVPKTHQRIPSR